MPAAPLQLPIGDQLVLRTARDLQDVERIAAFNGAIHGPGIAALTRVQAQNFPGLELADLFFVADRSSDEVVSSLSLAPWSIQIGAAQIPVGEMAIVGTAEPFRRRGLVRVQVQHFMQRFQARGCLIALIQGIPYYYRQFGYTYALPLEGGIIVNPRELPPIARQYSFRPAAVTDLPELAQLYAAAAEDLAISSVRTDAHWRYLLGPLQESELSCTFWLIYDAEERLCGYVRLPDNHFGEELAVSEVSRLDYAAALATLHQLVQWAHARSLPGVRLNVAATSTLARLARTLGARDLGTYAWQVQIPDLGALIRALGPTLEARLAASPFARLQERLVLDYFRGSVALAFANGRLLEVQGADDEPGEIRLPPDTLAPLLLGWRTIEELHHAWPDLHIAPRWRLLMETLFPPVTGHLYTCT